MLRRLERIWLDTCSSCSILDICFFTVTIRTLKVSAKHEDRETLCLTKKIGRQLNVEKQKKWKDNFQDTSRYGTNCLDSRKANKLAIASYFLYKAVWNTFISN